MINYALIIIMPLKPITRKENTHLNNKELITLYL